jgi:CrcB protein
MSVAWVFIGGGIGAACRWWLSSGIASTSFPYGTLTVNLIGCFLIGILSVYLVQQPKLSLLLITGFLGGFTTFSSFGLDSFKLLQNADYKSFATYVLASNVVGLLLVIVGHKLATTFI